MKLSRCVLLCLSLLPVMPALAAANWRTPTPEELSMTSQPGAPGTDAVILYREEIAQHRGSSLVNPISRNGGQGRFQSVYMRVKVLTEAGRKFATVEVPYYKPILSMGIVEGRTIHSDGTIVPFDGQTFQKNTSQDEISHLDRTVFTMPDVQVGSIVEYRYVLLYTGRALYQPEWRIQQDLFMREGHFEFDPAEGTMMSGDHGRLSSGVAYSTALPPGAAVKYDIKRNAFDLVVDTSRLSPRRNGRHP
jgi:hypothetical protein